MLTPREAAGRLGVSVDAVRKAIKRGTLQATLTKPGGVAHEHGAYLIDPDEVERYRREHLDAPPEGELRALYGDK